VQLKSGKLLDIAGQGLKEALTKSLTTKLESSTRRAASDSLNAPADSTGARADSAAEGPLRKGREALRKLIGK
jgi:hypothetical protein